MTLAQAKEGVELLRVHALVDSKATSQTKAGRPFLRIVLKDQTAQIKCVLWDYNPERPLKIIEGSVYTFDILIEAYNGALQGIVLSFSGSDKEPKDFAKTTPFDIKAMWKDLSALADSFTEPLTKFVIKKILFDNPEFSKAVQTAPAARGVHNAWYGGLLEHVWSLCQIARPVLAHYKKNYFINLSTDKVYFGLILHDAGKAFEYDYSTPVFRSSPVGVLTNHIVLGPAWVYEAANQFDGPRPANFELERAHLMHLLASHHGRLDWGSPVKPSTVEAVLVHHLDNLDAKVLHAHDCIYGKAGSVEGFSEKSYVEQTPFLLQR